ncbi:MAG: transporter substrate-binding domain-containing protein [Candidatus Dormibacteraeota bacterium]|nr:transporter substrate-binding domain-containing protein [Candidatus Dormibacteraeota bacterium]
MTRRHHLRPRATFLLAVPALAAAACGSGSSSATPAASGVPSSVTAQPNIVAEVPSSVKGTVLQIATDATYAPNEFIDPNNGDIEGWDIDMGQAICKSMGLVCTFNNVTFDDIIAQLQASTPAEQAGGDKPRYQFSLSSWTPTAKREASGIDFISYASVGEGWTTKSGGPKVSTAADLCGHRVAVEAGTTEEMDAWGYEGKMVGGMAISGDTDHCSGNDMTVDSYQTQTLADSALESGQDQIGFLDVPVAQYEVKVSGGKFIAGPLLAGGQPCLVNPYGIAVVKGSALEAAITDAMKYLITSGAYNQILSNWNVKGVAIPASQVTLNNNSSVGQPCVPSY